MNHARIGVFVAGIAAGVAAFSLAGCDIEATAPEAVPIAPETLPDELLSLKGERVSVHLNIADPGPDRQNGVLGESLYGVLVQIDPEWVCLDRITAIMGEARRERMWIPMRSVLAIREQ
jgi:hypothetical protein